MIYLTPEEEAEYMKWVGEDGKLCIPEGEEIEWPDPYPEDQYSPEPEPEKSYKPDCRPDWVVLHDSIYEEDVEAYWHNVYVDNNECVWDRKDYYNGFGD